MAHTDLLRAPAAGGSAVYSMHHIILFFGGKVNVFAYRFAFGAKYGTILPMARHCTLCPLACGADRTTRRGACGGGTLARVAKYGLHPYEEPAFDLIAIENEWEQAGAGVVGELLCPMDEMDFLQRLKSVFKAGCVKYSSLTGKKIRQVALCGGSGSFLIPKAVAMGVDAFVTGEIKYHEFFGNDDSILLAEIGHYESEQYTKDIFCEIITKKFPTFACYYTKVETNPINYL